MPVEPVGLQEAAQLSANSAIYFYQKVSRKNGKLRVLVTDGLHHKVLTNVEYRAVSGVFQNIDPPPPTPSPRSECVLPPQQRRGGTHSPGGEGVGVNILEDARHWIGLLQYNPSTGCTLKVFCKVRWTDQRVSDRSIGYVVCVLLILGGSQLYVSCDLVLNLTLAPSWVCKNTVPKIGKKILPEKKLHGLSPSFYIHISVSDLYTYSHDRSAYFLQQNRQTDAGNIYCKSLTDIWM